MPCAEHPPDLRFVFMASNQILFRPGLEVWVASQQLSFCIANMCTDFGWEHGPYSNQSLLPGQKPWRAPLDALSWRVEPPSPLYRELKRLRHSEEDGAVARDSWVRGWTGLLRGDHVPGWRSRPVGKMPHEGSFYPVWLLREFLCAIGGSGFDADINRCEGCRMPCSCTYRNATATTGGAWHIGRPPKGGDCEFEELLLPTYVWQRHPELLAAAAPPSVLRLFLDVRGELRRRDASDRRDVSVSTVVDQIASYISSSDAFQHVFGLKVPKADFDLIETALHATLRHARRSELPPPQRGR